MAVEARGDLRNLVERGVDAVLANDEFQTALLVDLRKMAKLRYLEYVIANALSSKMGELKKVTGNIGEKKGQLLLLEQELRRIVSVLEEVEVSLVELRLAGHAVGEREREVWDLLESIKEEGSRKK